MLFNSLVLMEMSFYMSFYPLSFCSHFGPPLSFMGRGKRLKIKIEWVDTLFNFFIVPGEDVTKYSLLFRKQSNNFLFNSRVQIISQFLFFDYLSRGLLSGHVLAEYFKLNTDLMQWYTGQLLELAKDIGFRLLPAFNTTTGIPHGRVR
jgi:Glycosyl hydrolase family 47.